MENIVSNDVMKNKTVSEVYTFHSINEPITKGLNTVTKLRIVVGSKLLRLAMFPVPKKADNKKNI